MFFSQNWPGSVKDVPKTISEAVHPRSSLITFLIDNKTRGKLSNHVLEFLLAVKAVLSCLWNLSINPFAQGWYAVVFICLTPNNFVNSSKSVDWNWEPLSVVIIEGQPKTEIHSRNMVLEIVSADISLSGTATGHLVNLSMMVSIYWQSFAIGNGPTISMCRFVNLPSGLLNCPGGDFECLFVLLFWQLKQVWVQFLCQCAYWAKQNGC